MEKEPRNRWISEFTPIPAKKKGLISLYQTYASYMVRAMRLELTSYKHWRLKPTCIPISPRSHGKMITSLSL